MTTETMTITKALSELKLLNKRIEDEIGSSKFCAVAKHFQQTVNGRSLETVKTDIQSAYDKIVSLINRNNAIKKALAQANAEIKITVNDNEMTIAEALYYKTAGIEYEKSLLRTLSLQYESAVQTVNKNNGDKLQKECEAFLISNFGTKENNTGVEEIDKARESYLTSNAYDIIEGINTKKTIADLRDKIDKFEAEIDAQITIANSTNTITIAY